LNIVCGENQYLLEIIGLDQKCKERVNELHPHHIKNFSQYKELRFAIDNGITFCDVCHLDFHKRYGFRKNNREQIVKFLNL